MLFLQRFLRLQDEAIRLKRDGVPAEGGGAAVCKAYWA